MDPADRQLALEVLTELLVGARVISLRFPFDPIVHFDRDDDGNDFSYLHIVGGFEVTTGESTPWSDLSSRPAWELAWPQLARLARRRVVTATLGTEVAHLSIGLDDGARLRVFGADPQYESWQVGSSDGGTPLVVALPDGDVAVWAKAG